MANVYTRTFFDEPSLFFCGLTEEVADAIMMQTSKIASFPSQAAEYYYTKHQVFIVNRSFDFIAPHYVLNAFLILVCVGFLSWSLDSQHGDFFDEVTTSTATKCIETTTVEAVEETSTSTVVDNISSIDPKADRRKTILKRTRSRRLTIENIARMIAIEDQKREEVFGNSPSPLDTSVEAFDMGIGGGDVGLKVWSLNQEIRLLHAMDIQLEKDGLTVFANPKDYNAAERQRKQQKVKDEIERQKKIEEEKKEARVQVSELIDGLAEEVVDTQVSYAAPYTMDRARKMDFKAQVLLRLRVPLRWIL